MRIAYLTFERPGPESGVGKKMQFHVDCWRNAGHDVMHFVLNSPTERSARTGVEYFFNAGRGKPMVKAIFATRALRGALDRFKPDVVYMRQMIWFPGLLYALNGLRVVQEINSDLEEELKLLRGFSGRVKQQLHGLTRNALVSSTHGVVYVTHELANRLHSTRTKSLVIANGYVFSEKEPPVRRGLGKRPSLIFVGSPGQGWHGVDKVDVMAQALPEFDFHLVVPGLNKSGIGNLTYHGKVVGESLSKLYSQMDVAIGSLALHRKNMDEACPLKCREYSAYGLPIISGCRDTDLSGASFYLELPNTEDNVRKSIDQIREFVLYWAGRPFPYYEAVARLDAVKKEERRLAFFDEVRRA